jgi:hypothetical protein
MHETTGKKPKFISYDETPLKPVKSAPNSFAQLVKDNTHMKKIISYLIKDNEKLKRANNELQKTVEQLKQQIDERLPW